MSTQQRRQSQRANHPSQDQDRFCYFYPLPKDTDVVLHRSTDTIPAKNEASTFKCTNYGLQIDRLVLWQWDKKKRELTTSVQARNRYTQQTNRRMVVKFDEPELQRLVLAYRERWQAISDECQQRGYQVRCFRLSAASRVVVGLGAESVLETSIHLHRVYGFPVLPGSSLKGLARFYAFWQIADELGVPALPLEDIVKRGRTKTPMQMLEEYIDESSDDRRRDELLRKLKADPAVPPEARIKQMTLQDVDEKVSPLRIAFGTRASAGEVIFFDAVPANPTNLMLELDVINPHYGEYYRGENTPPADYLMPVPVPFLAIAPGSEFIFAIAARSSSLADTVQTWLKVALTEVGIGAKTAAGYGLWR